MFIYTGVLERMRDIIYLATPYSHPDPAVELERFNLVTKAAALLVSQGHVVFSPITMTHPINLVMPKTGVVYDSDYWVDFDTAFMSFCTELVLLTLPGWQESRGVSRELEYFRAAGLPIRHLAPEDLEP